MSNLEVNLNGLHLKNPVTVASGTFGCGREYEPYLNLNELGAISVKGITLQERKGNPAPRLRETPMGLLNSVGLQNPGVEHFVEHEIPYLRQFDTKIIANINGSSLEEYETLAKRLSTEDIDSFELNVSCPNVKAGGMGFGTNESMLREVVKQVRMALKDKHLMVKLTPNVTDIQRMAKICEEEGADALSLVNTFSGMSIDINRRKPDFFLKGAGLSGPAIKPLALKKVYDVYGAVDIPILGMGGISDAEDALEFILAGASAIALGTILFTNPKAPIEVLEGIQKYLKGDALTSIIGEAHR